MKRQIILCGFVTFILCNINKIQAQNKPIMSMYKNNPVIKEGTYSKNDSIVKSTNKPVVSMYKDNRNIKDNQQQYFIPTNSDKTKRTDVYTMQKK